MLPAGSEHKIFDAALCVVSRKERARGFSLGGAVVRSAGDAAAAKVEQA
jgi:hypothetical protein